ncbi:ABC transporter substrate-binding protein [Variovorax paradoxus]|jgi:glutamate/aspartate transport system substrate-binding protein|uniref:amino acid ABC transporter substrate-binding protein n=1 Tax=Variovorax paradoxus TaxID=34073 RepID=UPI0006E5DF14|nr:ABC transporter substrate-binding protein [Variovorax paradoxus]KPV11956.1 ABC transporter substrate-binding protein [Variovorax paradoxus]KPV13824.1 ABC transporter substrate-binding protein [Variovorax paradoxus]KPV25303.1 ABC transporter substrate-binding protein [Variovorax paradoxus]KPV35760.1 ABC transporter substrate-binding protein [Variovorax paradoxus]
MKKKQASILAVSALAASAALTAGSALAQANDTLAKVKASGAITEGVRESSGLAYTLGNGQYTGFHFDVCANIIKDLEKSLGRKLEVKYQPVTSQNRIPLVQNGTVDLECGSTTNNAARQKDVAFGVTTYIEETKILVKANSSIHALADLKGRTVVTTTGTTPLQTLRKQKRAENLSFSEVYGKDHSDSFLLLESDRADAFVLDASVLASLAAKSKSPKDFRLLPDVLAVEPIAIMIRKDDPAFKAAVDESIKAQARSGELARLYDKWFLKPIPPVGVTINLPLGEATKNAWANPSDKPAEAYVAKE